MRKLLILGIVLVGVAGGAFVAGIFVERNFPSIFVAAPNTPTLLSPPEGVVLKTDVPDMWEFSWSKVPHADRYYVYIAHSSLMNNPVVSQEVEVPSYRLPNPHLMNNTGPTVKAWTWKIKAQVGGEWSKWSEVRTFDIEAKTK
jgi:hypothetical protein